MAGIDSRHEGTDSRREGGGVLLGVLFFLLLAAIVGTLLRSCADRDEKVELIERIETLSGDRDELAYKLADSEDKLSQAVLARNELDRLAKSLGEESSRLREDLAGARADLDVARGERDRYLADLIQISRSHQDALSELARIAPLREKLEDMEGTDAVRRKRLESAAVMARELLKRLREARAELNRREE